MTGLIPLRLQPAASGNRNSSSMVLTGSSQRKHARHSSMSSIPPSAAAVPISPAKSTRAMKHISQPILPSLPVLPYTQAEWKRTMAEIKRHHVAKRFRACSARCVEILEHLKDTSSIEPAHLIYLHFYAANSFEMCARPFPSTTPARTQLLNQARRHYDQAAALIQAAEASVTLKTRSSSGTLNFGSSATSSLHSPSGSVSSGTWSTPTANSSPTNSVCSFDDLVSKSSRRSSAMAQTPRSMNKAKKSVSFSLPKEETFKFPAEPYIRPDSPTLGFDDAYFVAPITRQELPDVPKQQQQQQQPLTPLTPDVINEEEEEAGDHERRRASGAQSPDSPFMDALDEDDYDRRTARSVHRYCETLSTLRSQIASHSTNLDALMRQPPASLEVSGDAGAPSSPVSPSIPSSPVTPTASDEMRALDRKARIERLRRDGWQRKRFDATRYERLCNDVMAELY